MALIAALGGDLFRFLTCVFIHLIFRLCPTELYHHSYTTQVLLDAITLYSTATLPCYVYVL